MSKNIVSDTSCLVLLQKLNLIHLLQELFGEIKITPEIQKEFGDSLPDWIEIEETKDKNYSKIVGTNLDEGEASAIALALDKMECLLILDDNKARKIATRLGLDFIGTLGILVEAKEAGFIARVKPILEDLKKTNFRITSALEKKILILSGEF